MLRALALNLRRSFGAGSPWRIMAPIAVAHILMLVTAALGLHALALEVDRSDAQRAQEAVTAAFNYQLSRLEMVTTNNAVYTEAWKAVGGKQVNVKWAVENWTVAPPNLPGHHGILLLEPDGRPVVGTRAGRPMSIPETWAMAALVWPAVRDMPTVGAASTRGLISTGPTPILVAGANVVPEPQDRTPESLQGPKRRLVLIHPMNAHLLATMNETIGGEQLKLSNLDQSSNQVVLPTKTGDAVTLSWRSRNPGRAAMTRLLKIIAPILLLVTIFLIYAMRAGLAFSQALKQAALIDPLTQLPNRAAFAAELDRRVLSGRPFTLGLIDLDQFKRVNDTYGHPAGDDLLRAIGEILKRLAAPADMVARLGGDEFAFICETRERADQLTLRLQVELARPLTIGSRTLKAAASVGVAMAEPGCALRAVVTEADDDLYANKRSRRADAGAARLPQPAKANAGPDAAYPVREHRSGASFI